MKNLTYRLPAKSDELLLRGYVQEHNSYGEQNISASMNLTSMDYVTWTEKINTNAEVPDGDWGRSLLFLCFCEDTLIGLLSIRYELPPKLRQKYGDIGYGVRPSQRKKGFASDMLRHGLRVCREHNMEDVVIGCFKDNSASAKVIKNNGGVLLCEGDSYEKGRISQYYRIKL